MNKYAQILNEKVHWIMEDEMNLEEIYAYKFNKDHIKLVDITGRDDIQEGWNYDGNNFITNIPSEPTDEELLNKIRIRRNALLAACDWTQLSDAPLTAEQKQAYATYRQALRDLPSTCDPKTPVFPTKPE